jgi:hypothetical protein
MFERTSGLALKGQGHKTNHLLVAKNNVRFDVQRIRVLQKSPTSVLVPKMFAHPESAGMGAADISNVILMRHSSSTNMLILLGIHLDSFETANCAFVLFIPPHFHTISAVRSLYFPGR